MKSKDSNSKKCVRVALGAPRLEDGVGWAVCEMTIVNFLRYLTVRTERRTDEG